jgi:hypothetical protein
MMRALSASCAARLRYDDGLTAVRSCGVVAEALAEHTGEFSDTGWAERPPCLGAELYDCPAVAQRSLLRWSQTFRVHFVMIVANYETAPAHFGRCPVVS